MHSLLEGSDMTTTMVELFLYRVTTIQTMWNSLTFPGQFAALLHGTQHVKCYSYALNTFMDTNMQLTINIFRQLFPDKIFSLIISRLLVKSPSFPWQLSNFLTFPGFPDQWSSCLALKQFWTNALRDVTYPIRKVAKWMYCINYLLWTGEPTSVCVLTLCVFIPL